MAVARPGFVANFRNEHDQELCTNCGKPLSPYWRDKCHHCGTPMHVAKPRPSEDALAAATQGWTLPVVIRAYANDDVGRTAMGWEAQQLAQHGYEPAMQSEDGGHVHAGRLILTGGLSIFAGKAGIRSDGMITVTFKRAAPAPAPWSAQPTLTERLAQLADAHTAGFLSEDEYQAKRRQILDGH